MPKAYEGTATVPMGKHKVVYAFRNAAGPHTSMGI